MTQNFGMKNYMKGAAILTIAALLVKVLSAIYRIPFQNMVGDEGFYIYQQVYPFIAVFVTWTTAGVAVAISKLLADTDVADKSFLRTQMLLTVFWYLTILSVLFFIILYAGANFFASSMGDKKLAPLLQTGAFIVLIMPMLSVMKGNFQSKGHLSPIAYAQVVEQFIRVCVILTGTWIIISTTNSLYAAGHMAIFGTVLAEYLAFILLFLYYKKWRSRGVATTTEQRISKWSFIKEVTLYSFSVSMSSLLLLSYQFVDSFTVFSILIENGMLEQQAKEMKGIYDRGQPLVQMGVIIASSLSLAIVPLVAHASKKQSGRDVAPFIQLTYRTSLVFGTAASLGLVLVMPFANQMLFETNALTEVLVLYVIQIIPLSIVLTFTAILQGYGKLKIPAIILLFGFLLKFTLNVTTISSIGVLGAAMASNVGLWLTAIGLILYLKKIVNIQLAVSQFYGKLFIAIGAMTVAVLAWQQFAMLFVEGRASRLEAVVISSSAIMIGAFVMLTMIAKMRLLLEKEWFLLPFGRRMTVYQLWLNRKSR